TVSGRPTRLSSRQRSAYASPAATSTGSVRLRSSAMKPCSMKSSGRAFAAGSMTSSAAPGCGARSKMTRMAAEDGRKNECQDRSRAHRGADGVEHRHAGKREYAKADHGADAGEKERQHRAPALLVGERQAVEEKRAIRADRHHQEQ